MSREEIALRVLTKLIGSPESRNMSKRQICDNAITYADLLMFRLEQIKPEYFERNEEAVRRKRIMDTLEEINQRTDL